MSSITVSSLVLGSLTVEVDGSDSILALSVLGTAPASLSIELGTPGATGTAATIAVGTTTTLSPGDSATVANVGTSSAAVFNFGIPSGLTGATGATGATGSPGTAATIAAGTTTTGAPGSFASVTNSGTSSAAVFDFAIPRGDVGATGATGATGAAGPGVAVGGTTGQLLTKASGTNYDTTWTTVTPGDRYLTTSTTSLTINNVTKTLTVGTGLSYTPTQNVTIAYDASNHMHGEVLTYNSGTGVMTVDVNHHTGTGTYAAWTVNVGGVTPVTSTAWGAITGTLSAQTDLQTALDAKSPLASPTFTGVPAAPTATAGTNTTQLATTEFVTTADNLKANLASPTFTGTPTLPTGTIATTQSPGNNTTALATTAFVTAAVPAIATTAQALIPTSTTVALSPDAGREMIMYPGYVQMYGGGNLGTSGTGAGATITFASQRWHALAGPNTSVAGYAAFVFDYTFSGIGMAAMTRGVSALSRKWNSKIWASGRTILGQYAETTSGFNGDANTTARVMVGGRSSIATGGMVSSENGIGWKVAGGGSAALVLTVSNGTTLTEVTSSFTPTLQQVFDWKIYSDGAGNVTLWVNDSQVATSTGGPTTSTAESYNLYLEIVDQTASTATRFAMGNFGTKVFWAQPS